jgi:hypothetical protein
MVLILLLGMAARLHDIEVRSLWADEGWSLVLSEGPTIPDIVRRLANDQHPPLYFIAIHLWRDAAGSSEFALRFLSAIIDLVGVAAIYQLGRSLFGRTSGTMAALFLAMMDLPIDMAQDVRHYAQMATFIILSSWFYFRLIREDQPSRGTRIGYWATSVMLLYSHYLGGFILICQFLHMLLVVRPWPRLRWSLFHFGAVCAAFLPWFPIVIRQNQVRWETPLYYLNSLPNSHETYVMVRDALVGKQYAITLVLMALGLLWVSYQGNSIRFRLRPWSPQLFLLLWLPGFIGMTIFLNERNQFLTVRNFIVVAPAVALLVGHGLANLQPGIRAFMIAVLLVTNLSTYDTHQLKPPWREVTRNISELHNPGEPVLMDIWVGDFPVRYYVEQQMGKDTPWLSIREAEDEHAAQFLPFLLTYIRDYDAFWLVYWGDEPIDYAGIFSNLGFRRTASPYELHEGARLYSHRYDRFSDEAAIYYGDGEQDFFALRRYEVRGEIAPGETIEVELWWTAEAPPPVDYSVSVFLLEDATGFTHVRHDGPPMNGQARTSLWEIGELQYDPHQLTLPDNLPPGDYTLGVKVYFYQAPDNPLRVPCGEDDSQRCDWVTILQPNID